MFLGGIIRSIDDGGLIAFDTMSGSAGQDSALRISRENDFLIRMGVSRRLLTDIVYRQQAAADGRHPLRCLTQDEARSYNIANDLPHAIAGATAAPKRRTGDARP